jgi:hypothetical protein
MQKRLQNRKKLNNVKTKKRSFWSVWIRKLNRDTSETQEVYLVRSSKMWAFFGSLVAMVSSQTDSGRLKKPNEKNSPKKKMKNRPSVPERGNSESLVLFSKIGAPRPASQSHSGRSFAPLTSGKPFVLAANEERFCRKMQKNGSRKQGITAFISWAPKWAMDSRP